jgi:hypothetical protein
MDQTIRQIIRRSLEVCHEYRKTLADGRAGLTSVRTGSAEQGRPHIRGPHTWQNFLSKFSTGVLVFGKKNYAKTAQKTANN